MRFIVTGANRGIGLELVRQLAARGDVIEAGARTPSEADELSAITAGAEGRVRVHACDIASDESVRAFAESIGDAPVDILINNAGVLGKMQRFEDLDVEDITRTFSVNALGPVRVARAVLPLLRRGGAKKIAHVSTGMGSITDNTSGGAYGYRMSKAALNMASRSMAVDLRGEGIISVVLNPGWVKTDMGGRGATTPVAESVARMLGIVDRLTLEQSGSFIDFRGHTLSY